ncbi:DUF84 family protein [Candidatus Woesearchaeota archaeon]|nr:DUF84 family protein [Candidatus Woesearchaeota archaeon]
MIKKGESMIINVGSLNKIKIEAVREVLADYDFLAGAEVIAAKVDSGVSSQPLTLEETIIGAKNRAAKAFLGEGYSIGLESGAHCIETRHYERLMELTVCALYDGSQTLFGYSSAFEIPAPLARLLREGMNLEQVCIKLGITTNHDLGEAEGLIGILSLGKLVRKEYTKQAVRTALFGLQNPELYKLEP